MSKATILTALNKIKNKLQNQKVQLDTDITNMQTAIDVKKAEKAQVKLDLDQINIDINDVTNSSLV
jgi:hypothetical protein